LPVSMKRLLVILYRISSSYPVFVTLNTASRSRGWAASRFAWFWSSHTEREAIRLIQVIR
jgi:hypothetical protein